MASPVSSPDSRSTTASDTAATSMSGKAASLQDVRTSSISGVSTMLGHTALMVICVLGQLGDEGADQPDHGMLGQAVDGVGREADQAGQGGGGHDGTTAPGREGGHQGPHPEDDPVHVDPDRPAVDGVGHLGDVGLAGGHPGIEMGEIDRRRSGRSPRRRCPATPRTDRRRPGARVPRARRPPARPRRRPDRRRPPRPRLGQAGGGGQADPRSPAGDHGHLAGKRSHWFLAGDPIRAPPGDAAGARVTLPGTWGILGGADFRRISRLPEHETLPMRPSPQ